MMIVTATRHHDFSAGHRVLNHESKCANLHGHNYRAHFTLQADRDPVGRVLDFSAIKHVLCDWIEGYWDHKFLVFEEDPWFELLADIDPAGVVGVPFNPTAENMAWYLMVKGEELLHRAQLAHVKLVNVTIEETRKCSATVERKL